MSSLFTLSIALLTTSLLSPHVQANPNNNDHHLAYPQGSLLGRATASEQRNASMLDLQTPASGRLRPPYAAYQQQLARDAILNGQLPIVTTDPNLLEDAAREKMTKGFDYIRGGAGETATMDANRLAFRQWKIVPSVLKPTTPRDLSVELFGHRYDSPVVMAPIGVQSLYHPDKEIGVAKACASLGVPYTLSTASSTGIEELIKGAPKGPKWFQLYWPTDEDITASLLKRARYKGYQVLVVTLDTWAFGWRPTDLDTANVPFTQGQGDDVAFSDPVFRKKFAKSSGGKKPEEALLEASAFWLEKAFPGTSHSWEDLKFLRNHWSGPIVLKGVLSVEDARMAVKYGMDGIVVSNHGGRQLDGAIASLDALPDIAAAVGDDLTVMMDSGIRTGADILKALSLGAKAVLVGRPIVYGLGINGIQGARAVLASLLADLDITMGFTGAKDISELTPKRLRQTHLSADRFSNI